ncbi:hypothetical protein [Treponema endosymbiont of Eucomonympha sp.]|nr:hypothetical protein [Treponema endosymbiont of Eucomonympha sp.]
MKAADTTSATDLFKSDDKAAHDNLAALADNMLGLKRREHEKPNP